MKLHLSYFSEKTKVKVRNEIVEIKAFQIIVWVSVSVDNADSWDLNIPRFPAILDIGTTHNFALTKDQVIKWAGVHPDNLQKLGRIRKEDTIASLCSANLWLHTDGDPFPLDIHEGIAVCDGDWPRLPVLGLRALTNSKLQTFIYGDTKQVMIRTPPQWYWPV